MIDQKIGGYARARINKNMVDVVASYNRYEDELGYEDHVANDEGGG